MGKQLSIAITLCAPFGTATITENAVPVWRWQFLQLQIAVIRGSTSDL